MNSSPINHITSAILETLFQLTPKDEAGYGSLKIDNTGGSFMPVSLDVIGVSVIGTLFSVAHYHEQNGDLLPDPTMTFFRHVSNTFHDGIPYWAPVEYQTPSKYDVAIEFAQDGLFETLYQSKLNSLSSFATIWLRNIKRQQGIKTIPAKRNQEVSTSNTLKEYMRKGNKFAKELGFKNYTEAHKAGKGDEIKRLLQE